MDEFKGPFYDHGIKYDYSHLPKYLQELISKLEEYDKNDDWFNYDIIFDQLEIEAKSYLIDKMITDEDYSIILRKYGGYCD